MVYKLITKTKIIRKLNNTIFTPKKVQVENDQSY